MKIGSEILASNIVLHKVLYVPSFKYNLVFINCLSKSMPKSIVYFFFELLMHFIGPFNEEASGDW